jgi:hypothetical protein
LDFFRHVAEVDEALQNSGERDTVMGGIGDMVMVNQAIGNVRQFEAADAMKWVRYWHDKGFLN